jgi:cytochrome d ubiquinol oxidase subunit I
MQHPVGYVINQATGRAELVDFFALITNEKAWVFVWHTLADGLATASFMIIGVSAYHLIRKHHTEIFKRSFHMASLVAVIASVLVFLGGHTMGQYMYDVQPMKLAAIEAIWDTEQPASFSLLTIGDLSGRKEVWSIRIPYAMSFLACNNFTCEVKGVNQLQAADVAKYGPGNYIPLMVVTYWTFRFMMTIGLIMIGASAWFLYNTRRNNYEESKWFKWVPFWAIALPYVANVSGWVLTEMGRQPWIVYNLLKVQDAVSPNLTPTDLLISLIGYTVVYGSLAAAMFYLMKKYAVAGPDATMHESVDVAPSFVATQD